MYHSGALGGAAQYPVPATWPGHQSAGVNLWSVRASSHGASGCGGRGLSSESQPISAKRVACARGGSNSSVTFRG